MITIKSGYILNYNMGSVLIFAIATWKEKHFCHLIIQNAFFSLQNILAERRVDLTALLVQLMQERDSRAEQLRERLVRRECSIIQPFFVQLNPSFTISYCTRNV